MSGRLVLVRHGQSQGNVERRLDTRPPGADLTDLGREQARAFARDWPHEIAMVAHSVALRAIADGRRDRRRARICNRTSSKASTRFRSANWRTATTTRPSRSSTAIYQRWHEGDLERADARRRIGDAGAGPLRARVTQLRMRYLDDDAWHGDIVVVSHGAAIRLVAATLAGWMEASPSTIICSNSRIRCAGTDHGRALELPALGRQGAAVLSRARRSPGRGRTPSADPMG